MDQYLSETAAKTHWISYVIWIILSGLVTVASIGTYPHFYIGALHQFLKRWTASLGRAEAALATGIPERNFDNGSNGNWAKRH
jgi:hypothetical protein